MNPSGERSNKVFQIASLVVGIAILANLFCVTQIDQNILNELSAHNQVVRQEMPGGANNLQNGSSIGWSHTVGVSASRGTSVGTSEGASFSHGTPEGVSTSHGVVDTVGESSSMGATDMVAAR